MIDPGHAILGMTFDDRPIQEPDTTSNRLVLGATGSWKTTAVTIPAIMAALSDETAVVISDIKDGEISAQIGDMVIKHGRPFGAVDDFQTRGGDYAHRIDLNPFGGVLSTFKNSPKEMLFPLQNVAKSFVPDAASDGKPNKDQYWAESPQELIEQGLRQLLESAHQLATPGGLWAFMSDPDTWLSAAEISAEEGSPALRARARQMLELREFNPDHYNHHMRAALSSMRVYEEGGFLHEAGRNEQQSHLEILQKNSFICLVNPVRHSARLGHHFALHNLSFRDAQLTRQSGKTLYILDEFSNGPNRPMLEWITYNRIYQARSIYIAQSRADIQNKYGKHETAILEENCLTKQWLSFSNFEEADRVSSAMGEIENVSHSVSVNSDKLDYSASIQTGRERLFSAEALMRLPSDEQILHISGIGFLHAKKIRQNEIAPYCYELAPNPLEGGILPPNPKVTLPTRSGGK